MEVLAEVSPLVADDERFRAILAILLLFSYAYSDLMAFADCLTGGLGAIHPCVWFGATFM